MPKNRRSADTVVVKSKTVNVSGLTTNRSGKGGRRNRSKRSLESGMMTNQSVSLNDSLSSRHNRLLNKINLETCSIGENARGWYYKYLDPAGSVEAGRAVGENCKIPDGLCTHSVDAEIRTITTLSVPQSEDTEISLSGNVWSLTILSFPMFRTGYIAVANIFNHVLSDEVADVLVDRLNSLFDYDAEARSETWIHFGEEGAGWFYRVAILPPTYDMPEPLDGSSNTVASWRMAFKSITLESNAPKLVDQGLVVGGNYAIPTLIMTEPLGALTDVAGNILITRTSGIRVAIPMLPQATGLGTSATEIPYGGVYAGLTSGGPLNIPADSPAFSVSLAPLQGTTYLFYRLRLGEYWQRADRTVIASPGNIVRFQFPSDGVSGNVLLLNQSVASSTITLGFLGRLWGDLVDFPIFFDLPASAEQGGVGKTIDLPAYNPTQIAANNPKFQQFQLAESGGGYLVHRKAMQPVFGLTSAKTFGPVNFSAPGRTSTPSHGTGLRDTIDSNFSVGVIVFTGMAWANAPILKLYMGWEGVANNNTPLGQFGHAGLPHEGSLLELVDTITSQTTGFYEARDNFAASLSVMAATMLGKLLKSQATQETLKSLANNAISWLSGKAIDRLNKKQQHH